MDYILQVEKIFAYFEMSLELADMQKVLKIKKMFHNDLNLIGCFLKDYLTIEKKGFVPSDEDIYHYFIIHFEQVKVSNSIPKELSRIYCYAMNYLNFVFEEFDLYSHDANIHTIKNTILTVNSCFALDCYPFLLELFYKYINKELSSNSFSLMLKSVMEVALKRFQSPDVITIDFSVNTFEQNQRMLSNLSTQERLVG